MFQLKIRRMIRSRSRFDVADFRPVDILATNWLFFIEKKFTESLAPRCVTAFVDIGSRSQWRLTLGVEWSVGNKSTSVYWVAWNPVELCIADGGSVVHADARIVLYHWHICLITRQQPAYNCALEILVHRGNALDPYANQTQFAEYVLLHTTRLTDAQKQCDVNIACVLVANGFGRYGQVDRLVIKIICAFLYWSGRLDIEVLSPMSSSRYR